MSNEPSEVDPGHNPNGATTPPPRGGDAIKRSAFARGARAATAALPSRIDGQVKRRPYVALGVAGVLGAAAGILLSSRILRAIVTATATAAALELTRGFIRKNVWVDAS
jgi:hypothetical protein